MSSGTHSLLVMLLMRFLSPCVVRVLVYCMSTKFTVGSMVVWVDEDRVLLVRSRYGERAWGFPGGVMDRLEDPVDCAVRELREETGIHDVSADELTFVGSHTQRHARHVDNVFRLTRPPSSPLEVVAGTDRFEIAEVQWWPVDELPELRREAAYAVERYPDLLAR